MDERVLVGGAFVEKYFHTNTYRTGSISNTFAKSLQRGELATTEVTNFLFEI
jgi:hypothetical protein